MPTTVLEQPTLILNRNWQPIHVTTVVRALVMLWNDAARVVEPDEYRLYSWEEWARLEPPPGAPCIRSARARLMVPEVVCLSRFDRLPSTAVTFSRRNVAKRDHLTCQYCRASAHLWVILVKCNACALGRLCVYLPRCGFHDSVTGG